MPCERCGRRCRGRYCRGCERDYRWTGYEAETGVDKAFLGETGPHKCDICDSLHATKQALREHECATAAEVHAR